jgi:hypothetical protein
MSTLSRSASLDRALQGIDAKFRSRLIAVFLALKDAALAGRLDKAGIETGKFCEISLRILQEVVTGRFTPFGSPIQNFADECRAIITAPVSSSIPESLRVIVPRALVFAYTMRNKRGIGHVGGDVDANEIDVATMTRVADWIVCELIRVYHKLSLEEAQDLVDGLAVRQLPDIWEVDGKKRVLKPGLDMKDQALLLMYSDATSSLLEDDLMEWLDHSNKSNFRRDVLRPLHRQRLIEFDANIGTVRISPLGIKNVEERLKPASI